MNTQYTVQLPIVIQWMNTLRKIPASKRERALESFWDTQLTSKCWLVNTILENNLNARCVYVFGGWTGVLSSLLLSNENLHLDKVYSIDINPWCKTIAKNMCDNNIRFDAITADMGNYKYSTNPTLVINTSTEHVSQQVYDHWYNNIPTSTTVIIQGNNFFSCDEHVRCVNNLDEFLDINHVSNLIYSGELSNSRYVRYMAVFKK
jgi:hypothetical protein